MSFDLESYVDARIEAKLRELGIVPTVSVYTRESLPPGYTSGEAFAGECRRIGLDRAVYREGKFWRVPADVWALARREDRERRRGPRETTPATDAIDATLERAGLRLVRGPSK